MKTLMKRYVAFRWLALYWLAQHNIQWVFRQVYAFGGGTFVEDSIAAATAVLGYDMLTNKNYFKQASYNRVLVAAANKGSAAAGDAQIAIKVGTDTKAYIYNTGTGFPNRDDMKRVGVPIPAGQILTLEVSDAPATNALNYALDITP